LDQKEEWQKDPVLSSRLGGQPSPPFRFFLLHNLLSFNRFRAIFFSCTKMIDSSIEESKLVFRSRRRFRQPIFPILVTSHICIDFALKLLTASIFSYAKMIEPSEEGSNHQ